MRELAAREGIDLAASYAYSDSESDLPMLRARRPPGRRQPRRRRSARIAREEGWEVMRFEQLGRRACCAAAALVGMGVVGDAPGVPRWPRRSAAGAR